MPDTGDATAEKAAFQMRFRDRTSVDDSAHTTVTLPNSQGHFNM
nr:MAG TPA: hypothetical protein [Caudoviricetes sp.]